MSEIQFTCPTCGGKATVQPNGYRRFKSGLRRIRKCLACKVNVVTWQPVGEAECAVKTLDKTPPEWKKRYARMCDALDRAGMPPKYFNALVNAGLKIGITKNYRPANAKSAY